MPDEFLPQQENLFSAGPDQYSPSDIVIGRIGANISAVATGSGVTGTQAWINTVLANTPSYSFAGVIHEIIVFDRKLTETERQNVYGYLSKKYKLTDSLPDSFTSSHPSAELVGLTYWSINHHPNSKGLRDIPTNTQFGGITLEKFFHLPDQVYKSEGTRLPNGTVLTGDTYGGVSG